MCMLYFTTLFSEKSRIFYSKQEKHSHTDFMIPFAVRRWDFSPLHKIHPKYIVINIYNQWFIQIIFYICDTLIEHLITSCSNRICEWGTTATSWILNETSIPHGLKVNALQYVVFKHQVQQLAKVSDDWLAKSFPE